MQDPLLPVGGEQHVSPMRRKATASLRAFRESMQDLTPKKMLLLVLMFGCGTGVVAWVYNSFFEAVVHLAWEIAPEKLVAPALTHLSNKVSWFPAVSKVAWVYTVLLSTTFGFLAGLVQRLLGSPGDLPDTVRDIHEQGYISINKSPSMFLCSTFSIAAGGSLGPEAPLLALCGATCSWFGKSVLRYKGQKLRNCALLGMTAGLAAFFGVALGGSLFALEVLHRSGMQFYEIATYAVGTGALCLVVFRALSGIPFGAIWVFTQAAPQFHVDFRHVLLGAVVGVIAAVFAILFMKIHHAFVKVVSWVGLHEHHTPVRSGLFGGFVIGVIGVLLPPVMFWGEFEIGTLAAPSNPLPHIWPKGGVWGLEPFQQNHYTPQLLLVIAVVKLITVSVTVNSGFRGGFIFPLFMAGTSLGLAITHIPGMPFLQGLPDVVVAMTMAAGLNTAITRTPFATSLILTALSGHPEVAVPCLASALVALFMTLHLPFIMSQRDRRDITIKELEFAEEAGQVVHIDAGTFSGNIREVADDGQQDTASYHVSDSHVQNWVISGQLTNANGHVDAPATPDQSMDIGGV